MKIRNIFKRSKLKLKRNREALMSPENSPTSPPQSEYVLNAYQCLNLLLDNNIHNVSVLPLNIEDIVTYFDSLDSVPNETLSKMQSQFKQCRKFMLVSQTESQSDKKIEAKNQQDSTTQISNKEGRGQNKKQLEVTNNNNHKSKGRRSILPSLKFGHKKKNNQPKEENDPDKDIWTTHDLQDDLIEIEDNFESETFADTGAKEGTHHRKNTSTASISSFSTWRGSVKYGDADPEEKSQSLLQEMDEILQERHKTKKPSIMQVFSNTGKL